MPTTVEEHEKAVADAQAALDKAKQRADAAAEAAKNPRPVGAIALDILRWLVQRAGNHPVAEKLLKELEASSGVKYDAETGEYSEIEKAAAAPPAEAAKD